MLACVAHASPATDCGHDFSPVAVEKGKQFAADGLTAFSWTVADIQNLSAFGQNSTQ